MKAKSKFSLIAGLGAAAFLFGFFISVISFPLLAKISILLCSLVTIVGFLAIFRFKYPNHHALNETSNSLLKIFIPIALVEAAIFFITFLFFYTFEIQTAHNARLYFLEPGSILGVLKSHIWSLGFIPCLLYAVIGVGFAYFAVHFQRTPSFSRLIIPNVERHAHLVLYNYFWVVTEAITVLPFIWVLSLTIVWLSEGAGGFLSLPSIFHYPFRTLFLCAIMLIALSKSNTRFLNWCTQKKIPLGGILVLYASMISLFIVSLQVVCEIFSVGVEKTEAGQVLKSFFAGSFTEEDLETRLSLLILGWWAVWIPWMSSFFARISISSKQKPWVVVLIAMVLPGFLLFLLSEFFQPQNWDSVYSFLLLPGTKIMVAVFLLLFMMLIWGRIHNTSDISRGAMFPMGQGRTAGLTTWVNALITSLSCYMLGHFMMGWLPAQVVCTVALLFMITMVIAFVIRMALEKNPVVVMNSGE